MIYWMAKRKKMMWKKLNFILFLVLFLNACSNRPKGVLSSAKMEDVLFEMYLVDGAIEMKNAMVGRTDTSLLALYQELLLENKISQADFDSSLVWYSNRPKQFKRIYSNVIRRLEEFKTTESARIDLADSLARMNEIKQYSLWNKSSKFEVGVDSSLSTLQFSFVDTTLARYDEYQLKFKAIALFKDSLERYHTGLYIYYSDGHKDSLLYNLKADSVERTYTYHIFARKDAEIDSIGATMLAVEDSIPLKMKFKFRDIDLLRRYKLKNARK